MFRFSTIVICLLLIKIQVLSQIECSRYLKGTYVALWGETTWSYTFQSGNTYSYETEGHFGNSKTLGNYNIINDTIFLNAWPKEKQPDTTLYFHVDTLLIYSDSCLLDIPLGYEHISIRDNQSTIFSSKRRNLNIKDRPVIKE